MTPRPDKYPEWAMMNVEDPVSETNNVVEPPPEKKNEGWARLEYPPRNWLNWMQRLNAQWIQYFDENLEIAENVFTPTLVGATGGSFNYTTQFGRYSLMGQNCFIMIDIGWASNTASTDLIIGGLPFASKTIATVKQFVNVSRGGIATVPNSQVLRGIILTGAQQIEIHGENLATGVLALVNGAFASGRLLISGHYIIEP